MFYLQTFHDVNDELFGNEPLHVADTTRGVEDEHYISRAVANNYENKTYQFETRHMKMSTR